MFSPSSVWLNGTSLQLFGILTIDHGVYMLYILLCVDLCHQGVVFICVRRIALIMIRASWDQFLPGIIAESKCRGSMRWLWVVCMQIAVSIVPMCSSLEINMFFSHKMRITRFVFILVFIASRERSMSLIGEKLYWFVNEQCKMKKWKILWNIHQHCQQPTRHTTANGLIYG